MKTVVLGLFNDLDTARRVLNQLAASPLDLDQISVVHGDLDVQRGLAREAGLPAHRGPMAGVVAGALVGAGLGYYGGTALAPEAVGWLLAVALGAVVGAVVGGAFGAVSETVRVPKVHQREVLQAIVEGATALIVRSDSLPTARAVGDLFRVAGSRELSPLGPAVPPPGADDPAAAPEAVEPTTGVVAEPLGESFAGATPAAELAQFAPPTDSDRPPAAVGLAGVIRAADETPSEQTSAHETSAQPTTTPIPPPPSAETLFAPPWRRGVVDPADVAPAPSPSPSPPAVPYAPPESAATPPAAAFAGETYSPPSEASVLPGQADAVQSEPATTAPADGASVPGEPGARPKPATLPGVPMVAGRTATQRIARLLLDAIDEAERPPAPKQPTRRRST